MSTAKEYTIFALNGAVVKNGTVSQENNSIDVSTCQTGTYLLKIESSSLKIIKK